MNKIKIEKGLVSEQAHPEAPSIHIFNYTQRCQFERAWDDVTKQCRGLIMNIDTGEVIARPFPKFFNYGEHIEKGWEIPTEEPIVTEKFDGSLGIMYTLNGKTWIATRGSFTSDQAVWATNWWRENKGDEPYGNEVTHLFEIIYPQNRIVVSYDFAGLVHLASIETATGRNLLDEVMPVFKAKIIPNASLEKLAALDEKDGEGFVAFFPGANVRLKIKFPEYVRLHRIVTGVSEIAIWEMLRDGKPLDKLIEKVPDEFYQWVTQVSNRLNAEFNAIHDVAERDFNEIRTQVDRGSYDNRKEFALKAQGNKNSGLLFALLDNKPLNKMIWRMVRPHGLHGFKKDIDA